jgi:hypothetical protein
VLFYLWSNKYSKWWRAGAWGYTEDIRERGPFNADAAMRFLVHGANDPEWTANNDEPKTIALGEDGRWYSLVEYDGDTPPSDPAEMKPTAEELAAADASAVRDDDLEAAA